MLQEMNKGLEFRVQGLGVALGARIDVARNEQGTRVYRDSTWLKGVLLKSRSRVSTRYPQRILKNYGNPTHSLSSSPHTQTPRARALSLSLSL